MDYFNSVPNNIFLGWSKLKAFVHNKFNVATMIISVFDRVENIVGRGENACYQHFFLFPQCFEKLSLLVLFKVKIMWYRVKD